MKKLILPTLLAGLMVSASVLAAVPASLKEKGEITAAIVPNYPPMDFKDTSTNTLTGLDVDLGNALAERLDQLEVQQLVDRLNEEIVENVQGRGFKSVMTTNAPGFVAIQISISSNEIPHTTFEALARWGRLLHTTYQSTSEMETDLCSNELHSSPTEVSAT